MAFIVIYKNDSILYRVTTLHEKGDSDTTKKG